MALSLAAPLAAGCGASDDAEAELEARLRANTGVDWLVDRDEAGAPKFITAVTPPPPIAASVPREQAAVAFLQQYADLLGAGEHGELTRELTLVADLTDRWVPGVHHLRFAQRIPGSDVRVSGADTFVHLDANGAVRFIAVGFVHDLAKINARPAKTADEARLIAEARVRSRDPQADVVNPKAPQLLVFRNDDGSGTLAWRVALQAVVDGVVEAEAVTVDAATGAVLQTEDQMARANRTAEASNVYHYRPTCGRKVPKATSSITYDDAYAIPLNPTLQNRLARAGDDGHSAVVTDGFIGRDESSHYSHPLVSDDPTRFDSMTWQQGAGAGVSAHENLAIVDAFFRSLGQQGWNNTDWGSKPTPPIPVTAVVHAWELKPRDPSRPEELRQAVGLTAYSIASDVIFFGDWFEAGASHLGPPSCSSLPMSVALDVVGHEFTHGVAVHMANIGLTGEAGAVNEALGDVFGAAIEHSVRPGDDNFFCGEAALPVVVGLRDMRSPRARRARLADKNDTKDETVPRAYSERLSTTPTKDNDNGHTHDNSVIVSHAFYLMAIGGTNEVTGITILDHNAIGWDIGAKLWHLSLLSADRRYVHSFHDFARVQTNLAVVLSMPSPRPFPAGTTASVACAWRAVEVFTDADLKHYGVTCSTDLPPLPPPATPATPGGSTVGTSNPCAGHGDQPVCDDAAPNSAIVCRGGANVGTALCADPAQRCARTSDSDPTAKFDGDGALVCE